MGTENRQGEVRGSGARRRRRRRRRRREAVGVKMEALRGSCERTNGLAAGRQPERGRAGSTLSL